jgi:hypothetical protein
MLEVPARSKSRYLTLGYIVIGEQQVRRVRKGVREVHMHRL